MRKLQERNNRLSQQIDQQRAKIDAAERRGQRKEYKKLKRERFLFMKQRREIITSLEPELAEFRRIGGPEARKFEEEGRANQKAILEDVDKWIAELDEVLTRFRDRYPELAGDEDSSESDMSSETSSEDSDTSAASEVSQLRVPSTGEVIYNCLCWTRTAEVDVELSDCELNHTITETLRMAKNVLDDMVMCRRCFGIDKSCLFNTQNIFLFTKLFAETCDKWIAYLNWLQDTGDGAEDGESSNPWLIPPDGSPHGSLRLNLRRGGLRRVVLAGLEGDFDQLEQVVKKSGERTRQHHDRTSTNGGTCKCAKVPVGDMGVEDGQSTFADWCLQQVIDPAKAITANGQPKYVEWCLKQAMDVEERMGGLKKQVSRQ